MEIETYEQALVFAARNGNQMSFEELYKMFYPKVFALARMTVKNEADAEDVLQQTFISAWQNIGKLEDINAFSTWLQRICLNHCYALLRKHRPNVTALEDEVEDQADAELDSDMMLPDVYAEKADLKERLGRIIDELSDVQRQTLTLYYFGDLSVEEIAQVMEVSEGTVKSRLFLARKAIRTEIEEQERKTGQKFYGVGLPLIPFAELFRQKIEASSLSETTAADLLKNVTAVMGGERFPGAGTGSSSAASSGTGGSHVVSNAPRAAVRTVAETTTKTAATAATGASKGSAAKIIAALLAAAVVIGGGVGVTMLMKSHRSVPVAEVVTTAAPTDTPAPTPTVAPVTPTEEPAAVEPEAQNTAAQQLSAYEAYLNCLQENQSAIDQYNWQMTWQSGQFTLGTGRQVALADITGDDIPELIYMEAAPNTLVTLHIVTCRDGVLTPLYSDDQTYWDGQVGGGFSYYLFKVAGDDALYAYLYPTGESAVTISYSRFTEAADGSLVRTPVCEKIIQSSYTENGGYAETVTYRVDGVETSEDGFAAKEEELKSGITEILPYSMITYEGEELAGRLDLQAIGHAMTSEEAILYLQALISQLKQSQVLANAPSDYLLQGSAGAWFETLSVQPDGSFELYSEDTDAGSSGDGYQGTTYYSTAHGTLTNETQINDYTYSYEIGSWTPDGAAGEEWIEDFGDGYQMLYTVMDYGDLTGQMFYLYTPDAPVAELPEDFEMWSWMAPVDIQSDSALGTYAFYNAARQYWYFPMTDEAVAMYNTYRVQAPSADAGTLTVTGDVVNIRTGPGTEYDSIGTVNQGSQLTIIGKSGNWYEVQYYGSTGYIIEDYVTANAG